MPFSPLSNMLWMARGWEHALHLQSNASFSGGKATNSRMGLGLKHE